MESSDKPIKREGLDMAYHNITIRCMHCGTTSVLMPNTMLQTLYIPLGWTGTIDRWKCPKCSPLIDPPIDWDLLTNRKDSSK